jgi:hypothetical protein
MNLTVVVWGTETVAFGCWLLAQMHLDAVTAIKAQLGNSSIQNSLCPNPIADACLLRICNYFYTLSVFKRVSSLHQGRTAMYLDQTNGLFGIACLANLWFHVPCLLILEVGYEKNAHEFRIHFPIQKR